MLLALSAYGSLLVSATLSVNSLSSSNNLVPVKSNSFSFRMYFSGLNSGVSGGLTVLLNSLSAGSVTFTTNTLAVPSCLTSTVTTAFIVSYVTVPSVPLTSSTV